MLIMSLRRVFSDTARLCSRSAPLLLVCPRCGASTKSSAKGTTANPKLRKTSSSSSSSSSPMTKAEKTAPSTPASDEADLTYADLSYGSYIQKFGSPGTLLDETNRNVFRATRALPGEMYIAKEDLADRIAELMGISSDDENCTVMEGNPGMGFLTEAILKRGVKKIRVYENRSIFVFKLQELQRQYGAERLEIVCPYNIFDYRRKSTKKSDKEALLKLNHLGGQGGQGGLGGPSVTTPPDLLRMETPSLEFRFEELLNRGREEKEWAWPTPVLKFVGVVPQRTENFFLRRLINNVAKRRGFANRGRPEFFLVLTERQHDIVTAFPNSETNLKSLRWISIVFQTIFDVAVLQKIPREDFLPPVAKKREKGAESWSLIRLTAKKNLPEIIEWAWLPEYVFFVNQALVARKKPIIAWIEGWIPGYGKKLLDLGKTLYLRAGDLSAQDYTELFQRMSKTPEYAASNLRNAFLSSGQMELPEHEEDEMEDEQIVPRK